MSFWTISIFWITVLVFIGIAMAAVLVPLLRRESKQGAVDREKAMLAVYRDQLAELKSDLERGEIGPEEYEAARLETEKRLSEELPAGAAPAAAAPARAGRWAGYSLAVVIPLATIGLYAIYGNPAALDEKGSSADSKQHDIAAMVTSLESKMQQNPGDPNGWVMLGRSYEMMERFPDAEKAFAKAVALVPNDAGLLSDYAEAMALAQGKVLAGKPMELLDKALKIKPTEQKALELSAIAAAQAGQFAKEATFWRRLQKALPPDSDMMSEVVASAERAEAAATAGPGGWRKPPPPAGAPAQAPAATGASISGTVQLGKELAGKAAPGDTVWIIAKAPEAKMPLAIVKIQASQLPYKFTLDDSNAMMPGSSLSSHPTVNLVARISKSGDASVHTGDLQGSADAVKVGQKNVAITINSVAP